MDLRDTLPVTRGGLGLRRLAGGQTKPGLRAAMRGPILENQRSAVRFGNLPAQNEPDP